MRVLPLAVDRKQVTPPCDDRRSGLAVGRKSALDAPWIEQNGEPCVLWVPQLLIEKRVWQTVPTVI